MRQKTEVLLFDLGGVLIEFSGLQDIRPLLRRQLSESDVRQRWSACPTIREFEIGKLTSQEFAERFVSKWDLAVTPSQFLSEFRSWVTGLLPGARDVLVELKGRFRLACLSNSNETHWDHTMRAQGILELFDAAFASHQLGFHKPDPEIYQRALSALRVKPEAVVFFDDSADNVLAARALRMEAHQIVGTDELRARLVELGFLYGPGK